MHRQLHREYRTRSLTKEEVARDEEIRLQVQAEFPRAMAVARPAHGPLTEALKKAIRDSGQTEEQIAKQAGVPPIVISRFLSGERDIRMATADKLAAALHLRLTNRG